MQEMPGSAVGSQADVAALDIVSEPTTVWDSRGSERDAPRSIRCELTVLRVGVALQTPAYAPLGCDVLVCAAMSVPDVSVPDN